MRSTTAILQLLFDHHQPYSDAKQITCDVVLELMESKLDEGLSYLEGEDPRRAREEIRIVKEFGSMENFRKEAMKEKRQAPSVIY